MNKELTPIMILLLFFAATVSVNAGIIKISASSSQDQFTPDLAMDKDMQSRWSSEFSDDQWLEVMYDEPIEIVGIKIHWETAYGRDYDLELCKPDGRWILKNQIRYADGGVDEIYFGPETIKGFKIKGHKRGTGWGYSIWEIETLGPTNKIRIAANSQTKEHPAQFALDGQMATYWQSDVRNKVPVFIELNLPEKIDIGGIRIEWAQSNASPCTIQVLTDESVWKTILNKKAGLSSTEDLFFKSITAGKLRLLFPADLKTPVQIAEIQIKGQIESWTPVRHYEMLAQRLPDGFFPGWLRHEQTFWTITGLPGSFNESLLDEYGRVESGLRTFSVTPILVKDGKPLTAKDFDCSQSLLENWAPIPTVQWNGHDLTMKITADTIEPDNTLVLYNLQNTSKQMQQLSLVLAVRPLQINPPWQYGGFSDIHHIQWKNNAVLNINKTDAMQVVTSPTAHTLYEQNTMEDPMDVVEVMMSRETPESVVEVESRDNILSAAMRFDLTLQAGQTKSILAVYPNTDSANIKIPADYEQFFQTKVIASLNDWKTRIGDWEIRLPDPRIQNLIRSNLAYLLINADGPALQPGSRNYNSSWIRDGAVSATAMMRFGLEEPVQDYLNWFTSLIPKDGFIPFLVDTKTGHMVGFASTWTEHDSFGQYAYLVRQVVEITDNKQLAKTCWPKVKASMRYMQNLRNQQLTKDFKNTEYEGILPKSNSHEGYFPAKHSYWDDFFALRGLQDAQALAQKVGHEEDRQWLSESETHLRASVLASIQRVMNKYNLNVLPGCAELGDFDPTSTAVAVMVADERDTLPRQALEETYKRYITECSKRAAMPFGTRPSYTPYEVRNIAALTRLQRPAQARMLLDYFMEDAVRPAGWNQMAEVVHGDPRTASYIGDMPHTWVGAGLINAIRDMLVYEDRDSLVLAAAVSTDWIDRGISVRNLQTWWGPVSYELNRLPDGQAILRLTYQQEPPNGFIVPPGIKLIKQHYERGSIRDADNRQP